MHFARAFSTSYIAISPFSSTYNTNVILTPVSFGMSHYQLQLEINPCQAEHIPTLLYL